MLRSLFRFRQGASAAECGGMPSVVEDFSTARRSRGSVARATTVRPQSLSSDAIVRDRRGFQEVVANPNARSADLAYGSGDARADLATAGHETVIKASCCAQRVHLDDCVTDDATGTVTCPNGLTRPITSSPPSPSAATAHNGLTHIDEACVIATA